MRSSHLKRWLALTSMLVTAAALPVHADKPEWAGKGKGGDDRRYEERADRREEGRREHFQIGRAHV